MGTVEERYELIVQGLEKKDISGGDKIKSLLAEGKSPKCLWVTSPTGKPHVGYLIPLLKFIDFLKAGCEITIVLLDVYSFLDNVKIPMAQVIQRMNYYKYTIMAALDAVGIPLSKVRFIQESMYQKSERWIVDQWSLLTLVPQQAVRDAWDRSYNPDMLSPMLCPCLQTLAEEHLDIDFQFGGQDQAGIFAFAERFLPQMGYKKRAHLMNPMLPNLYGGKMSSSHPPETKIMFLDSPGIIHSKVGMAYDYAKTNGTKNGVMEALKNILIPLSGLRDELGDAVFRVPFHSNGLERAKDYKSFQAIQADIENGQLHPDELKDAISEAFNNLLDPIRKAFAASKDWQECQNLAYPDEA